MFKIMVMLLIILFLVLRILYLEDTENFVDQENIKELMARANAAYSIEQSNPVTFADGVNFSNKKIYKDNDGRDKNTLENLLMGELNIDSQQNESDRVKLFDDFDNNVDVNTYDSRTFFDKCMEQEHMILNESMNQNIKLINLKAELERLININKPIQDIK